MIFAPTRGTAVPHRARRAAAAAFASATVLSGIVTACASAASAAVPSDVSTRAPITAPALLCGYPLKKCPAGRINPTSDTPLGPGYLLASQATAANTGRTLPVLAYPAVAIDYVDVSTKNPFSAYVVNLPRNSTVLASVVLPSGKRAPIGIIKTSASGNAILPAMRFSRPGETLIALTRQNGQTDYIKVIAHLS